MHVSLKLDSGQFVLLFHLYFLFFLLLVFLRLLFVFRAFLWLVNDNYLFRHV